MLKSTATEPVSEYEQERGKPMPSKFHSLVQINIGTALKMRYRKTHSIHSELSLNLGDRPATPDVSVYLKSDISLERDEIKMTQPPLLIIEILSPTQAQQEVADKIEVLLGSGVKAAWLVQPTINAVSVFLPAQKPKTFTEGIISDGATGIELSIDDIFNME